MNDFDTDYVTTAAMIRYGGSFVAGLGDLWRHADAQNKARLKHAFGDYFDRYAQMAALKAAQAAEKQA